MPKGPKGEKRLADVVGNAVLIGKIATGETQDHFVAGLTDRLMTMEDIVALTDVTDVHERKFATAMKRTVIASRPYSN